jgi:hypothetical protein
MVGEGIPVTPFQERTVGFVPVKPILQSLLRPVLWLLLALLPAFDSHGGPLDRWVGTWSLDEGFQIVELTFRSDGRYQIDTRSTDPVFDLSSTDRGRYGVSGGNVTLTPYEYFGTPSGKDYRFTFEGDLLALTRVDLEFTQVYQFKPGSRERVIAQERVERDLVGRWQRRLTFSGTDEYTFRPRGYFVLKRSSEDGQFPPDFIRGRYSFEGDRLVLRPYRGVEESFEVDFFGTTLALIRQDPLSGEARGYELVSDSRTEVRAKSAEAEAFLARPDWQVGVWEIREPHLSVQVTFRPEGRYVAVNTTEFLQGTVRGRYALESRRIQLLPFVGQDPYARSNGDFGKFEQTEDLDYYDGELHFIDPGSISQKVILARKVPGSEAQVMEKSRQARIRREQPGWQVGLWEVRDPLGWMQFTFRPDDRYLAMAGTEDAPGQVERGRCVFGPDKVTLAPYAGLGASRGFELDLYDGDLFLVGDRARMVIARKVAGSEAGVIAKTRDPVSLKGERGSILGLWTAPLPGQSSRMVFRDDGEFRLDQCTQGGVSRDYGLYRVDMTARTLVIDSRFRRVETLELDFYGDTMTIHGGVGAPVTYVVHPGEVDAAMAASHAADAEREITDDAWRARVPLRLRDPGAVQVPVGTIPADPQPGRIFADPTVFSGYQLYRRLIPGFVYFNVLGTIKSVAVVNTREWHFFPTGRVLVRFKNYYAGAFHPSTLEEISDNWGAYRIAPVTTREDVLHRYADDSVFLETDLGEAVEMTLEEGRRNLFWEKDYQIQSEWAAEQKPIPCQLPLEADASLLNTGIRLATTVPPDEIPETQPALLGLEITATGRVRLRGTVGVAGNVVVDRTRSLTLPRSWEPVQTNQVPAGPFTVEVPREAATAAFFRIRRG